MRETRVGVVGALLTSCPAGDGQCRDEVLEDGHLGGLLGRSVVSVVVLSSHARDGTRCRRRRTYLRGRSDGRRRVRRKKPVGRRRVPTPEQGDRCERGKTEEYYKRCSRAKAPSERRCSQSRRPGRNTKHEVGCGGWALAAFEGGRMGKEVERIASELGPRTPPPRFAASGPAWAR